MSLFAVAQPLTQHFGCVITALTLQEVLLNSTMLTEELPKLIFHYRLVLFRSINDDDENGEAGRRGKNIITPEQQIAVSRALGRIESTFYKHRESPHPDIFRVSNEEHFGCTNVGRTGWHNDGTFLERPFRFQTMHFPSVSKSGSTQFLPLREFLHSRPLEVQDRWRRMVFLSDNSAHRLVYAHPDAPEKGSVLFNDDVKASKSPSPSSSIEQQQRLDDTMVFHLGRHFCKGWLEFPTLPPTMPAAASSTSQPTRSHNAFPLADVSFMTQKAVDAWVESAGGRRPQFLQAMDGIRSIQAEIDKELAKGGPKKEMEEGKNVGEESLCVGGAGSDDVCATLPSAASLVYTMKWQENDFAILDNRALSHYATEETQLPASVDGLRILHRTTMMEHEE